MEDNLIEPFKRHLHIEDESEDDLLMLYLKQGENYVLNATGKQTKWLILMVAGIFYEYRVAEKELGEALDAMTPFFIQEVYTDAEETDKSIET